MRILYMGPLWLGGTCLQRMKAMQELVHEVIPVDTKPKCIQDKQQNFIYKVRRKLFGSSDLAKANYRIRQLIKEKPIDVLWLDKALTIKTETLKIVWQLNPKTVIAGYSPDDMIAKHNQSNAFLKALPFYDVFFTTKSYGVKELEALGVPRAVFIGNAYDPYTHRPVRLSKEEKKQFGGQVGFIGDFEIERAQSIYYLARHGIPVRIWGPNWDRKCRFRHSNLKIEGESLWGDNYTKAICSFDINLHFLRKINRDLQTQRSIEIPACGSFMLAERTNEHLSLFKEGMEAEFFSSDEELLEKLRYYLKNEKKRKEIAQNGRERCLRSGYSNHDRLKKMIKIIENLNEKV